MIKIKSIFVEVWSYDRNKSSIKWENYQIEKWISQAVIC